MPYGDSGSGSTSSSDGIGASRPYRAPPVEQNSTRAPAARAASSTFTVPTALVCASSAGAATETRTSICAARWQIRSGLARLDQRGQRPGVGDAQLVQHGPVVQAGRPAARQVVDHRHLVAPGQERVGQV